MELNHRTRHRKRHLTLVTPPPAVTVANETRDVYRATLEALVGLKGILVVALGDKHADGGRRPGLRVLPGGR
jgi:hypothetical protein